ncbi:MAG: hypothetical protein CBD27_12405 [Rhodospirillaceae bacterium TMED167]|nr:hypothetical protein [Rhodospirillaceae bacterium]OUW23271.1 MAG: hypothetical protein CBD27_12405 [Rhodospirillaceae bacterium TMED167]
MNHRIFVAFFVCLFFSANGDLLHADDLVGAAWKSENVSLPEGKIAYIDPKEGTIYEVNLDGLVTWKYQIPSKIRDKGDMRKGADIEWLDEQDHFLFVVPGGGIYEVNRKKEIVWFYETDSVSHDADRLPNGNTIFVNAWDKEGDNQVVEIAPDGKKVFEWKIADSGVSCAEKYTSCNRPKRRGGPPGDYTHVNAVQKLEDGSFSVSLRNLNTVVLIAKDLKIIERHQRIRLVHDPRLESGKLVAIARRSALLVRDRKPNTTKGDGSHYFKYSKKGYSFLRTNERISADLILLTDSTHLLVFDRSSKKLVWKMKLNGFGHQKENKNMPFLYKAAWIGARK